MKIMQLFKRKAEQESQKASETSLPEPENPQSPPQERMVERRFGNLKLYTEGQTAEDEPILDIPSDEYLPYIATAIEKGIPPEVYILQNGKDYQKMLELFQSLYGGKIIANWTIEFV